MPVYRSNAWKIDTGNWTAEPDEERFVLKSPDNEAELEIDTYDYGKNNTWNQLLANVRRRAPQDAQVVEVSCGHFAGFAYEYVDKDQIHWREWHLSLAEIVLFITCSCAYDYKTRYRDAVDQILATLTDARP